MTGRPWTKRDESRLRVLYPDHSQKECAVLLRRSAKAVASRAKSLRVRRKRNYRIWTSADDAKLCALYPNSATKEIARFLGRQVCSINGRAHTLGLHKSPAYMAGPFKKMIAGLGNGIRYRFPKGHIPANKGLRRPGWSAGRMRETQFKKGQRPFNTLPIGIIMANADGYLRIKVSDAPEPPNAKGANSSNWEFVHRRVWEAAHGPVPKGHRIWWKDRNHLNNALENLELLSDAEHMARTTIHNLPPELKATIQMAGRLKRKIKEKTNVEKQDVRSAGPPVRNHRGAQGRGKAHGRHPGGRHLPGRERDHQLREARAAGN